MCLSDHGIVQNFIFWISHSGVVAVVSYFRGVMLRSKPYVLHDFFWCVLLTNVYRCLSLSISVHVARLPSLQVCYVSVSHSLSTLNLGQKYHPPSLLFCLSLSLSFFIRNVVVVYLHLIRPRLPHSLSVSLLGYGFLQMSSTAFIYIIPVSGSGVVEGNPNLQLSCCSSRCLVFFTTRRGGYPLQLFICL